MLFLQLLHNKRESDAKILFWFIIHELEFGIEYFLIDRLIEKKLCLNYEFINRTFKPIHIYNTKELFVDIRDRFSPSRDKEISWLNYLTFKEL